MEDPESEKGQVYSGAGIAIIRGHTGQSVSKEATERKTEMRQIPSEKPR